MMIAEIEKKILGRLQDKGLQVKSFDIEPEGKKGIKTPAAFARIDVGKITRTTQVKFKVEVYPVLSLVFKNLKGEEERRDGIYPLLMAVLDYLTLSDLGMSAIDPLAPEGFQNVTDDDDVKAGYIVFQIRFKTHFYITKIDDEVAGAFLTVGLEYFLQDPEDDGAADASDEITLQ